MPRPELGHSPSPKAFARRRGIGDNVRIGAGLRNRRLIVRYTVLMLAATSLLAAALVPGPMVAAHELDSEQPLTRAQELANTTVLKIHHKNPLNMKDRLAPG